MKMAFDKWPMADARWKTAPCKDPFIDTERMRKAVSLEHGNTKNMSGELAVKKALVQRQHEEIVQTQQRWISDAAHWVREACRKEHVPCYAHVYVMLQKRQTVSTEIGFARGWGKGLSTKGHLGNLEMVGIFCILMVVVVTWLSSQNCSLYKEGVCTLYLNLKNIFYRNVLMHLFKKVKKNHCEHD